MKRFLQIISLCIIWPAFYIIIFTVMADAKLNPLHTPHPVQTITINALINPANWTITGSETIRYIKYYKGYKEKQKKEKGIRYKIKYIGDKFQNFNGLNINIGAGLYLMLYPNSLSVKPKNIKDFDFHQLYPYGFDKGFISVKNLSEETVTRDFYKLYIVTNSFKTKIPQAFGNFGHFKKEITLNAPFYPYISAGKDFNPEASIGFKLKLKIKKGYEAFFDGKIYKRSLAVSKKTNFISLILTKRFKINKYGNKSLSLKFFQPGRQTSAKNEKIYKAFVLLNKFHMVKAKRLNIVYVHIRRSLWLKPPLYSVGLPVNTRFGGVFPNFYIYQKLNVIKGLIYLNTINSKKIILESIRGNRFFYSEELRKISIAAFKKFLKLYIKKNPDIKNLIKKINFIQGVNTVINYPVFPLSYIYFTGFPHTHRLKNGVYYYDNDLNLIGYKKIKEEILNRKKNDYYTLFLSGAGGNISPNSGRTEGFLNFTLTKKHSYRNGILFNIFKNYYYKGIGIGFSKQIGRFFPISQTYKQSVFGTANLMEINPEASGDSIIYQNTERLVEFGMGYSFNSMDYNINPEYGSSFNFSYNIANSNILSPFSFSQFIIKYVKNFEVNSGDIIAVRGTGVLADGKVPTSMDYYFGGINGIMGVPASLPFINSDTIIVSADYERNIYRGLNLNLLNNLIDIKAVTGDIIGGAGKLGGTVSGVIGRGNIYSFTGLGVHFKTYFLGIYPEMISIYAAKAFGNGVSSEYGVRYYFGLNQPF